MILGIDGFVAGVGNYPCVMKLFLDWALTQGLNLCLSHLLVVTSGFFFLCVWLVQWQSFDLVRKRECASPVGWHGQHGLDKLYDGQRPRLNQNFKVQHHHFLPPKDGTMAIP